jgi:hypothetical protein
LFGILVLFLFVLIFFLFFLFLRFFVALDAEFLVEGGQLSVVGRTFWTQLVEFAF